MSRVHSAEAKVTILHRVRAAGTAAALASFQLSRRYSMTALQATDKLRRRLTTTQWLLVAGICGLIWYFFFFIGRFSKDNAISAVRWLTDAWNSENADWSHGWFLPPVMLFLAWRALPAMKKEESTPSGLGLAWIVLGLIFYVGGIWTIQARLSILAFPFIVLGVIHYLHGWKVARHVAFPLSVVFFMVPVPGLQQATNSLQILVVAVADKFSHLVGIETIRSGTELQIAGASWKIDEGCSGIRSLVALTLVTYIYGMLVHQPWKERLIIFAACIPIAMLANCVRIISIVLIGLIDQKFAAETWHDYSGFIAFAAALGVLVLISKIIKEGVKALRPKTKVTRISRTEAAASPQ